MATWGEFQATMRAAGVKDTDTLYFMDGECAEEGESEVTAIPCEDNTFVVTVGSMMVLPD